MDRIIIGHTRTKDGKIGTPYGIPQVHGAPSLNDVLVFNVDTGIAKLPNPSKTGELSALEYDPDRGGIILHEGIERPTSIHPVRQHLEPIFERLHAKRVPAKGDLVESSVSFPDFTAAHAPDARQLEFDFGHPDLKGPKDPGRFPKRLMEICQDLLLKRAGRR